MGKIAIASPQEIVTINRAHFRQVVRSVLESEGAGEAEISLAFVDNETIHTLNKRYLDHDEPTDVLSFPYSEPGAQRLAGELVLGVEVARAQAAERGHDVQAELTLYVIHGLLHLCGQDDRTEEAARAMRTRERQHLQALGLPDITEGAEILVRNPRQKSEIRNPKSEIRNKPAIVSDFGFRISDF